MWSGRKHFVFVEKIGPFQANAPQAWQALHTVFQALLSTNQITGCTSLYKMGPQVYRAGVSIAAPPRQLPGGVGYLEFGGSKYSCFVLTGPYDDLGKASGRVMETVAETKLPLRDDFFLENCVNDPRTTPPEQLITEILVPTT